LPQEVLQHEPARREEASLKSVYIEQRDFPWVETNIVSGKKLVRKF
jgi:hypothetical protein